MLPGEENRSLQVLTPWDSLLVGHLDDQSDRWTSLVAGPTLTSSHSPLGLAVSSVEQSPALGSCLLGTRLTPPLPTGWPNNSLDCSIQGSAHVN